LASRRWPIGWGSAAAAAANALSQRSAPTNIRTGENVQPPAETKAPAVRPVQPPTPPQTPVAITPGVVFNPELSDLAKNEFSKFTGPGADAMKEGLSSMLLKLLKALMRQMQHAQCMLMSHVLLLQRQLKKVLMLLALGFLQHQGSVGH
jgi:hypothetical protein